jgi:hypothetical protein
MSSHGDPPDASTGALSSGFDLLGYLTEYLSGAEPKFFMIMGPVGSGKSTLLRSLVPRLSGPKLYLAYHTATPATAGGGGQEGTPSMFQMLLVDPQREVADPARPYREEQGSPLLAFGPSGPGSSSTVPPSLTESLRLLGEAGSGTIVVDSWDRGSEAFFREQVHGTGYVESILAPASAMISMRTAIPSSPLRFILAVGPETGTALLSMADAVAELREEGHEENRLRVLDILKVRGTPPPVRQHLYTLERGHFRSLPGLPSNFRPPFGPPDEDPDPHADSGWPGSIAFEHAFGRLRFGGFTAVTLSEDCSETIPRALTIPIAIHVLLQEGRVVVIPAPSVRPAQVISVMSGYLPAEKIRERVRVLSPGGNDPNLGDFRSIMVPLHPRGHADPRPDASGLLFPELFEFLQNRPESTPAVILVSLEGLRAAASAIGVPVRDSMLPVEVGIYSRIPRSHIFGYGSVANPAIPHVRSSVDTLLQLEMIHGRPVIFGVRPRTAPFLLDWPHADGRYSLVPVL